MTATPINVAIQGMVMLVGMGVYVNSGGLNPPFNPNIGAALTLEASSGGAGSYGVPIPAHTARIVIQKSVIVGTPPARFVANPDDSSSIQVVLKGDVVQIGKVSAGNCVPLTGNGADGTASDGSLDGVPDLSRVVANTTLAADARPDSMGQYYSLNKAKVAGWLETKTGTFTTRPDRRATSEFRPSLYQYNPSASVTWSVASESPCLAVTPFGGSTVFVKLDGGGGAVPITFENMPDGHAAMDALAPRRRGVSYDFELMYGVLAARPAIPPVPHNLRPASASMDAEDLRRLIADDLREDTHDAKTGFNCGPGGNPHP